MPGIAVVGSRDTSQCQVQIHMAGNHVPSKAEILEIKIPAKSEQGLTLMRWTAKLEKLVYYWRGFFISVTADELWKGALAETGVGVKKGSGKRRKKKLRKNLNKGQEIGEGRVTNKGLKSCLDLFMYSLDLINGQIANNFCGDNCLRRFCVLEKNPDTII